MMPPPTPTPTSSCTDLLHSNNPLHRQQRQAAHPSATPTAATLRREGQAHGLPMSAAMAPGLQRVVALTGVVPWAQLEVWGNSRDRHGPAGSSSFAVTRGLRAVGLLLAAPTRKPRWEGGCLFSVAGSGAAACSIHVFDRVCRARCAQPGVEHGTRTERLGGTGEDMGAETGQQKRVCQAVQQSHAGQTASRLHRLCPPTNPMLSACLHAVAGDKLL